MIFECIYVLRIGQLASEMSVLMSGQSVGGSNGNADELTNWDGTKKRSFWYISSFSFTLLAGLFSITDPLTVKYP